MAQYNITSPDGTKYQVTAPDDATQDQIMNYVQQNHASGSTDISPQKADFLSRVGLDIKQSVNKGADIITAPADNAISDNPLSRAIGVGGQAANAVLSPMTEAISSGYSALPDQIKNPISDIAQRGVQGVKSAYRSGIDELANTDIGRAIGDYGMNSPALQRNMQGLSDAAKATANLVSTVPLSRTSELVGGAVADAAKNAEGLANKYAGKYPNATPFDEITPQTTPKVTPEGLSAATKIKYDEAYNAGANLNKNGILNIADNVDNALANSGELNPESHKAVVAWADKLRNEADKGSMSIEKLDQKRQGLLDIISDNTSKIDGANTQARKASIALDAFDNAVDDLKGEHTVGGQRYTPSDLEDAKYELGKLQDLHDNLINGTRGIEENVKFNETPWGNWRDRNITNAAQEAKSVANVRQQIKDQVAKVQDIQDNLTNAPAAQAKAAKAVDSLNQARDIYSAKARLNTLQRIHDNAAMTKTPQTALQTGYRNLAKQVNVNPRGWTPEEVKAINYAAKTGIVGGALNFAGSRIISALAGAAGGAVGAGPLGAAVGAAVGGAASRPFAWAGDSLQAARGNAVKSLIEQRPALEAAIPMDIKQIMQLPPKQAREALNNYMKARQIKSSSPLLPAPQ